MVHILNKLLQALLVIATLPLQFSGQLRIGILFNRKLTSHAWF